MQMKVFIMGANNPEVVHVSHSRLLEVCKLEMISVEDEETSFTVTKDSKIDDFIREVFETSIEELDLNSDTIEIKLKSKNHRGDDVMVNFITNTQENSIFGTDKSTVRTWLEFELRKLK